MSTSQPRKSTHDAILDAALRLFTERGADEITLEDIAQQAGVSRQSVYVHFGSRTGLFVAIVQYIDTLGVLEGLVRQIMDAPTSLDALDALAHLHAEYSPIAYPVAKVLIAGRHEDPALKAAWDDRMEARRNVYRWVVQWLARDGLLSAQWDDEETATEMVCAITSWQVWELLVLDGGWTKERYERHLGGVLRLALVGGAQDAPPAPHS